MSLSSRIAALRVETATKRRIFLVALIALSLWPLAHYALSRHYHLDHWRFSGFAMYTRPADEPFVEIAGQVNGRPLSQPMLAAALGPDVTHIDRFLARRRLWGELERPDALAQLILARIPQLAEVTIYVDTVEMAPGADHLSGFSDRYDCARPVAPGATVCVKE